MTDVIGIATLIYEYTVFISLKLIVFLKQNKRINMQTLLHSQCVCVWGEDLDVQSITEIGLI